MVSTAEERKQRLAEIFGEIWEWARAYDRYVVKRQVEAIDPSSRLFVVSEAPARAQVRLTGINWFDETGKMGAAGRHLDTILGCFGYTVRPPIRIPVANGVVESGSPGLRTLYTTDVFPCYPPGGGTPSGKMIADALRQGFLVHELEILRPKVVLLLGGKSYRAFIEHVLKSEPIESISASFTRLSPKTRLKRYQGTAVVPFYHPSPLNSRFTRWFSRARHALCEQPQVQAIAAALVTDGVT